MLKLPVIVLESKLRLKLVTINRVRLEICVVVLRQVFIRVIVISDNKRILTFSKTCVYISEIYISGI